jgi:FkbM family methyltransferase
MSILKRAVHRTLRLAGLELKRDFDSNRVSLARAVNLARDPFAAVHTILGRRPAIIFDVGAHEGQTALALARRFPEARIYAFEPTPATAARLRQAVAHLPNVSVFELALGDREGKATLHLNAFDQTNSLLPTAEAGRAFNQSPHMLETMETVEVPVRTIEAFCAEHGIERIDLLKTDAQGHDLAVVEGAGALLAAIPLLFLEVSFIPYYEGQPTAGGFIDRLYDLGYRFVAFYEQNWHGHYYQYSCNGLFVRADVAKMAER